jgi:hypothetical protein
MVIPSFYRICSGAYVDILYIGVLTIYFVDLNFIVGVVDELHLFIVYNMCLYIFIGYFYSILRDPFWKLREIE